MYLQPQKAGDNQRKPRLQEPAAFNLTEYRQQPQPESGTTHPVCVFGKKLETVFFHCLNVFHLSLTPSWW